MQSIMDTETRMTEFCFLWRLSTRSKVLPVCSAPDAGGAAAHALVVPASLLWPFCRRKAVAEALQKWRSEESQLCGAKAPQEEEEESIYSSHHQAVNEQQKL